MKLTLAVLLVVAFSLPAFAQDNPLGAPGCGPTGVKFNVKSQGRAYSTPAPDQDKAQIVFLQDDEKFGSRPRPTTRFGIDGAWVGATQANSYFYVSVDPGEHHLCANWENRVSLVNPTRPTAAVHFTAEAGKVYYFRARDIAITDMTGAVVSGPEVKLEPVDSDEAKVLLTSFAFSTSKAKR
jgi:hypothetical protein